MAIKRFTDASIRALKLTANPTDRYERFEPSGLGVRVGSRSKSFIFLYRYRGTARRMTLGRYPEMSLTNARFALAEARKRLDSGEDPGAKAIEHRRAERDAETVAELADLYMRLHARPKKKSWREDQRMLNRDVLPAMRRMKANDVTRRDLVALREKADVQDFRAQLAELAAAQQSSARLRRGVSVPPEPPGYRGGGRSR